MGIGFEVVVGLVAVVIVVEIGLAVVGGIVVVVVVVVVVAEGATVVVGMIVVVVVVAGVTVLVADDDRVEEGEIDTGAVIVVVREEVGTGVVVVVVRGELGTVVWATLVLEVALLVVIKAEADGAVDALVLLTDVVD